MLPVQVVLDEKLLKALDREAKKASQSRSEFIRLALLEVLDRRRYLADIEAERRAYERQPETKAEKAGRAALRRGANRALATSGDEW